MMPKVHIYQVKGVIQSALYAFLYYKMLCEVIKRNVDQRPVVNHNALFFAYKTCKTKGAKSPHKPGQNKRC